MSRKKHPFETQRFSKLYACAYQRYKTGYELSMDLYERYEKSNELQKIMKENPDFFESKQHPKKEEATLWRAKSKPLCDYIFDKTEIPSNDKEIIRKILNRQDFRALVIYQSPYFNVFSILGLITICAGVTYTFLKIHRANPEYFEEFGESQKIILKNTQETMKNVIPKEGQQFLNDQNIDHIKEVGNLFVDLEHNTLEQLMRLSPPLSTIPELMLTIFSQFKVIDEGKEQAHKQS